MTNILRFISFEGLDFSGKSTQIRFLMHSLQNIRQRVLLIREPGGTEISEKIRSLLLDKKHMGMTDICEALLYSAARHQLVSERVIPALNNGMFVIADRFVDSTTAYQGYGRKIPMPFLKKLNITATEEILPAITFYLDIDIHTLNERKLIRNTETDRLENQDEIFYKRIRKGYLKIAELNKSRVVTINGTNRIEEIKKEIWRFVSEKYHL